MKRRLSALERLVASVVLFGAGYVMLPSRASGKGRGLLELMEWRVMVPVGLFLAAFYFLMWSLAGRR